MMFQHDSFTYYFPPNKLKVKNKNNNTQKKRIPPPTKTIVEKNVPLKDGSIVPSKSSDASDTRGLIVNSSSLSLSWRSEEHTSELQSRGHLVCRLLLEKKNEGIRDLRRRRHTT